MKIRALSSFSHPQEGARAEGRYTKRRWIPMDSHRRATQTRLLRLAHAVKCRRQMSPCRRQQLRREAQPPCALLHRVQALGSENLNRLNLNLVSTRYLRTDSECVTLLSFCALGTIRLIYEGGWDLRSLFSRGRIRPRACTAVGRPRWRKSRSARTAAMQSGYTRDLWRQLSAIPSL